LSRGIFDSVQFVQFMWVARVTRAPVVVLGG